MALNAFLRSHRVMTIERVLIQDGANSYWSVLVDYSETDANPKPAKAASSRVDYREVLQPDEFDRYVRLRELRKQLAEDEAIPPYAIFTNEQLAELAKIDSPSKEKMSQIPGVGKARMTKYSDRFLERLQSDLPDAPAHEADR